MSTVEDRLAQLERRLDDLAAQMKEVQGLLTLVGDVQRFSRLRDLLGSGDLDAADLETERLLLDEVAGGPEGITPESLERCPAPPLLIMDALWRSGTGGRQGFQVQQRIYRDLGGSRDSLVAQEQELFGAFTQRVGWPLVAGIGFALPEELTVPVPSATDAEGRVLEGHLPLRCWGTDYGLKAANLLMARLFEVFAP